MRALAGGYLSRALLLGAWALRAGVRRGVRRRSVRRRGAAAPGKQPYMGDPGVSAPSALCYKDDY